MGKALVVDGDKRPTSHTSRRKRIIMAYATQHNLTPAQARERLRKPQLPQASALSKVLAITLDELGLTIKPAKAALKREGLTSVQLITGQRAEALLDLPGFGPKALGELQLALQNLGRDHGVVVKLTGD